ncbi:MAG: TolC family protein, partial [Planctomycetaceae bacterium]|nr:TolC family protein [Planctomycetaceae bacterium]
MVVSLLLLAAGRVLAQPTPPVVPKTVEVQLPPPVELPPPDKMPEGVTTAPIAADEAAAIALYNQPAVTVAGAGIEAAKGRTAQVRSGLKPTVGVSAAVNASEVSGAPAGSSGGAPSHYQLEASVEQLIYDYNHTRDLVQQSLEQEKAATAALTTVQGDLVLSVKQAFYGLLEAQRLVTVAESNVR